MTIKNRRERIGSSLRAAVYQRDRGLCQLCGKRVGFLFHCDHVKPVAFGGSTILSNLRLACSSCNTKRGTGKPRVTAFDKPCAIRNTGGAK